jgi:hypothetical protein
MPSRNGAKTRAVLPFSILALPLMATTLVKTIPQTVEKTIYVLYNIFNVAQGMEFDPPII